MKSSARWLNSYLAHGDQPALSAAQIEHALTFAGLPIESTEAVKFGAHDDVLLDVEVTSNRGDCLCHYGLARELAAATGRILHAPCEAVGRASAPGSMHAASTSAPFTLRNDIPAQCPRFTARAVTGVKVGPSPAWLRDALLAIGQRSINNIVDATNFVLHELGNPCHAFDLERIAKGPSGLHDLTVRAAAQGEKVALLDGTTRDLRPGDMIIADATGPISLAGIMGGGPTAVSDTTSSVLLEVATWSPAQVRATARRLNIRTDASHRFERVVDARTIDAALDRLTAIVLVVAGGGGGHVQGPVVAAGAPVPALTQINLSIDRCRRKIGLALADQEITNSLHAQGFKAMPAPGGLLVSVPAHRPDVRIEEDLVEEVARTVGYARVPMLDTLPVRLAESQRSERAGAAAHRLLTGAGFFEAVTFSFTTARHASPFVPPGLHTCAVSDDRRGSDNILRPSVLTGLLSCRRANQDAKVDVPGGVRLYEIASVFAEERPEPSPSAPKGAQPATIEHRHLALLADLPERDPATGATLKSLERRQLGLRLMRGVIDALVDELAGPGRIAVAPLNPPPFKALLPEATAGVTLAPPGGAQKRLGYFGLHDDATLRQWELHTPVVVAELNYALLIDGYPPRRTAHALPAFPATQRDLSLIVTERTPWAAIAGVVGASRPQWLEDLAFIGVYRGQPIDAGKKSVTLRMTFRDHARTLRDDEVNAEVDRLVGAMTRDVGAVLRTV